MKDYARRYFHEHASEWLDRAYPTGVLPLTYPLAERRVALALDSVFARVTEGNITLADLGCGGGDLAIAVAQAGTQCVGVDLAEAMIEEANRRRSALPLDVQGRTRFLVGDAVATRLLSASFDAVVALGLIEYLPDDDGLLAEAARILRQGGLFVVSCRNRLFSMLTVNQYTRAEVESGSAGALLAEIAEYVGQGIEPSALGAFADNLVAISSRFNPAAEADIHDAIGQDETVPTLPAFAQPRRQHTPRGLSTAASHAGFATEAFVGLHPHMLPPFMERLAPRLYNCLSGALDAFEQTGASLVWSSSFMAVFRKLSS